MQSPTASFDAGSHLHPVARRLTPLLAGSVEVARVRWPDWQPPTLPELAARLEHQFGKLPALAGVHLLGFASDEALTPWDVREVCDLLGVPAADLGLDV
jgi:hypothetical protein